MWCEVFVDGNWMHIDPCETVINNPLMYETGWGKKLTWIMAIEETQTIDVTSTYTNDL